MCNGLPTFPPRRCPSSTMIAWCRGSVVPWTAASDANNREGQRFERRFLQTDTIASTIEGREHVARAQSFEPGNCRETGH
eukprot:SAG11_NODE_613_length_8205_cov_28.925487_3_plen_80_part_00